MRYLQTLSCYPMLYVIVEFQPESSVCAVNTVATVILKMLKESKDHNTPIQYRNVTSYSTVIPGLHDLAFHMLQSTSH